MFTDAQWREEVRGDYPADLFARCRPELLASAIAAVMDLLPEERTDQLAVESVGDEHMIVFGPFDAFGWAPLSVSGVVVSAVHATQLWPDRELQIAPLVEWL